MSAAKVLRVLDKNAISDELASYLRKHEGSSEAIDADLSRDWSWTDEIMSITKGYIVVDNDGNKLASATSAEQAAKIASSAKISINLTLDEPEPELDLTPDDPEEDALPSASVSA